MGKSLYDKKTEGRIYACIADLQPRIYASEDGGISWKNLYTYPEYLPGYIKFGNFKMSEDGRKLYFAFGNIGNENDELYGLYALDVETKHLRQYPMPNVEDHPGIESFDIYGLSGDTAIMHTSYYEMDSWSPRTKVFYTQDGGESWDMIYYSEEFDTVHAVNVAISPNDPEKLFIARTHSPGDIDGGLLISKDGGKTWKEHMRGVTFGPIAFNPNNPDEVMVGTWIGGEIHDEFVVRSTDGGETWNRVNLPPLIEQILDYVHNIRYFPGEPDKIMIIEENEMFYTQDGGNNWERLPTLKDPATMEFFMLGAEINPFNPDEMYVFEDGLIYHTADRCQSFTEIEALIPGNCSSLSAGNEYGTPYLYYINPAESKFYQENLATGEVEEGDAMDCDIVIADETRGLWAFLLNSNQKKLYYKDENNLLHELPGEATDIKGVARDPFILTRYWIAMNGSIFQYELGDFENILRTEIQTPDSDGPVSGIYISPIAFWGSKKTFVAKGSKIFRTDDGGETWADKSAGLGSDIIRYMNVNVTDDYHATVFAGGKIYRSEDSCETWTLAQSGYTADKAEYSYLNSNHIAAVSYVEGEPVNIIYSKDNGLTWNEIESDKLRNPDVTDIDFHFGEDFICVYAATADMGRISYQFSLEEDGEACTPPHSLRINVAGGCVATLNWLNPDGNPAATYNVYRDGVKIASAVSATTYADAGFEEGEHIWSVRAICATGESAATSRKASCIARQAPRDINVAMNNIIGVGDCGATITWNYPYGAAGNETTFNIYRNNALIQSGYAGRSYTDNDFETGIHNWCISATYTSGESGKACLEAECLLVCEPTRNLAAEVSYDDGECKAALSWDYPEGYETAVFNIYRDNQLLQSEFAGLSYTDSGFECGEHQWEIITICGDSESDPAIIRSYCSACEDPVGLNVQITSGTGGYVALLTWNTPQEPTEAVKIFEEGFEEGIPSEWKNLDRDADGQLWVANYDDPYIFDAAGSRLKGEYVYSLVEWVDPSDGSTYKYSPDNWLVTAPVTLTTGDASLNFFVTLASAWWIEAYYEVYISTTGRDYDDFILLYSDRMMEEGDVWYERNIPLTGYTGEVYLAFRNLNKSTDRTLGMKLDEVSIIENPYSYNIYRDGNLIDSDVKGTSFLDESVPAGEHEWCVEKICAFGKSLMSCKTMTVTGMEDLGINRIAAYPNPTTGHVTIENAGKAIKKISLFDVSGNIIQVYDNLNTNKVNIDLSAFSAGIYFIKIGSKVSKVIKK